MNEAANSTATILKKKPAQSGYPQALAFTIGALAIVSMVLQHGFAFGQHLRNWFNWFDVILTIVLFGAAIRPLRHGYQRRKLLREFRFEYLLLGVFTLTMAITWVIPRSDLMEIAQVLHLQTPGQIRLGLVQLFLLGNVSVQMLHFLQRIFAYGVRPQIILAGSFACLILLGTLLLLLPRASSPGNEQPLSLIDAF
ncbi:MAG: hypothetical protein ACK4UN_20600, partial [Limisphaerales bacterium]